MQTDSQKVDGKSVEMKKKKENKLRALRRRRWHAEGGGETDDRAESDTAENPAH